MKTFRMRVEVAQTGKSKLPDECTISVLALETGWDYFTIKASPAWFIGDVIMLINAREASKIVQAKKLGNSNKRGR